MKKLFLVSTAVFTLTITHIKTNAQTWLWAKRAGGADIDAPASMSTDANGNVFMTGWFYSPTITFGSITLTNTGAWGGNVFIVKYDSNGNALWAKSAGGNGNYNDESYSVSTDANGNAFITGQFSSPSITFGSTVLNNVGSTNIFIVKYDPNGNVLWAKGVGGTSTDDGYSVSTDASGNIFVTGMFASPTITFGSITLTNPGGGFPDDIFIAKYNANGNVLWAKSIGGTNNDVGNSVSTDASGNVFVTGYFDSPTITFGATTLINAGIQNIFIVKYDSNGNVLWAKSAGGTKYDEGNSVCTDVNGNVFLTGLFESPTITFGSNTFTNAGGICNPCADAFIVKYDANGNVLWAKGAGGTNMDAGDCVSTDASGNVYLAGGFASDTITFGSITLSTPFGLPNCPGGCAPIFLIKFDGNGNVLCASAIQSGVNYYNNHGFYNSVSADPFGNAYISGNFEASPLVIGTYSLSCSAGAGGQNTFIAKYNCCPAPNVTIAGNTILCSGDTTTLTATGGVIYSWITGATGNPISVSPSSTNSYSVIVTGANGCTNSATATVTVTQTPVATIFSNSTICAGDAATLNSTGGGNYSWNTGATTSSIQVNPNTSTNYSVIVSNINCTDTAYASIIVNPKPTAGVITSTTTVTYGQSATLTAGGGVNYSWNDGENGNNIIVAPTNTTIYCVEVTDINNCSDTACVTIVFYDACASGIYLPNAFSPNEDGENDFLQIYYENSFCVTSLEISIYNRLGENIFYSTDPSFKWNGKYKDKMTNTEVVTYYLRATLIDGKDISKKGNISLVR